MGIKRHMSEPERMLNLTCKWMCGAPDPVLKCHFHFQQACHQNLHSLYCLRVYSVFINHVPTHSWLILLYEWQRFRMKLDCVLLSPPLCHKSFLKCAISSYLYTLIICVKSSYLNHLHNWLAASLWSTHFAFRLGLQYPNHLGVFSGYSHVRI